MSVTRFLEAAKASAHYPVLPERSVLWQALQEGTRENRWVLYLRGPSVAIGAQEMNEWPGTPRFEDSVEVWLYQAALDSGLYPRKKLETGGTGPKALPLTSANLKSRCWPAGTAEVSTEDLERYARNIWADLSRPRLETVLRDGVREGAWAAWRKGDEEIFYTREDNPSPQILVSALWSLVEPTSVLGAELADLRPGRGPQPRHDPVPAAPGQNGHRAGQLGGLQGADIAEATAEQQLRQHLFLGHLGRGFKGNFGVVRLAIDDDAGGDVVLFGFGDKQYVVSFQKGKLAEFTDTLGPETCYQLAIRGPAESWAKFCQKMPPPMSVIG